MRINRTEFPEVLIIEPNVFKDDRGYFFESYNKKRFSEIAGTECDFVQDNHSRSSQYVLRGLHYQTRHPQGKLVRVIAGEVYDVVVDLRSDSPSFGRWFGLRLSSSNKRQIWIPVGFAHGFLVLSETAEVLYKTTDYYAPGFERCIRWDDPELAIDWPLGKASPILSEKDQFGLSFKEAEYL